MTRNTDNRTTEHTASELVKALLDERGADYRMRQSVTNGSMDYYDRYTVFIDGSPRAFIDTGNGDEVVLTLRCTPEQAIAATVGSERERELELLVKQLWYLVNHRSGYGYAAALESIEELGLEVD